MSEDTGVPTQLLNELFIGKANSGKHNIADISAVFITDRLSFDGKPKPHITCEFRRIADTSRWDFEISRDGEMTRRIGVELTDSYLISTDMPVTYLLEKAVREELGLNGTKEERAEAHKTPIVGS